MLLMINATLYSLLLHSCKDGRILTRNCCLVANDNICILYYTCNGNFECDLDVPASDWIFANKIIAQTILILHKTIVNICVTIPSVQDNKIVTSWETGTKY